MEPGINRIGQLKYYAEELCDLERDILEMIEDADLGENDAHGFFKGSLIVTLTHVVTSEDL